MKLLIAFLFSIFCVDACTAQFYSGSQTDFGKNRVKYEDFFWTYYSYPHYDVYFYEEGKGLANYVSKSAQKQIDEIEKLFDFSFEEKIQFIIYNKQSDFKQSNIGLSSDEQYNTGGVTRIAGSKIILYFEGDHAKLDAQIRSGIGEVLMNQMMYGGNVREMFKNNTLLNLPEWYTKGLISYVATDWNSDIDNRVKDGILSEKFKNINRLEGEDAVYAGHAIWKHIADNYGEAVISNILYMTKVSRNIDNSTMFVMGISIKNLWKECFESYTNKYIEKDESKILPSNSLIKKPKSTRVYSQLKVSSDGNFLIYVTNEMGQFKIWLYDVQKEKTKRILKSGQKIDRINDYSYPLLAWHPSGKLFSYVTEKKGSVIFNTYELQTGERTQRAYNGFEKILDYGYSSDGKKIILSAVKNGQTDLYMVGISSNGLEQITNDSYDDLNPRFVHNSKEIVFVSNRPLDTLFFDNKKKSAEPQPHKDLFVFDNVTKSHVLKRITNTPTLDEIYPSDYDSTHISYLSDLNGIRNRYIARFDSTIAFVDTSAHYKTVVSTYPISNYSRNILEQDVNIKAGKVGEIIFENGKYKMFISSLQNSKTTEPIDLKNTSYREYKNKIEKKQNAEANEKSKNLYQTPTLDNIKTVVEKTEPKDSSDIDINNYVFESEKKLSTQKTTSAITPVIPNDTSALFKTEKDFELAKQKNYYTNYSMEYVISQLDNSFLNASYQKFTGDKNPIYLNPSMNALFKISMNDLFEDYRITGALRLSGDINSNEFLTSYENRLKKLDRQTILHRQSLSVSDDLGLKKVRTHDIRYLIKLPFSEVASLRASISYRNDNIIYLSSNDFNLKHPNVYENWGTAKLEYVFDNTINKGLNLYNGSRAKIFGEYYRQIEKSNTDFFVVGMDWRYYKKIHRCIIWANRIAASTSFGNQKLIYYMGGVDNWFGARFNTNMAVANDQNFAYQTIATNLRGFEQNARNGNTFVLANSEIRFPIFKYLYKRPIRADFIENFQLITFGDLGTAWTGTSPYDDANSLNTTVIGNAHTPLIITLKTQHNPIIGGYGWGIRTRLFGYFIRIDRAWGIEDGARLTPLTYLSLSLDF